MNRVKTLVLLAASAMLAMVFTVSCSDDKDDDKGSDKNVCVSKPASEYGVCYDGYLKEACDALPASLYEWKSGGCPSDYQECKSMTDALAAAGSEVKVYVGSGMIDDCSAEEN